MQLPDVYVAEADLLLPLAQQVQGVVIPTDPVATAESVHTEVMLAQSQPVLRRTVEALDLQKDDEFVSPSPANATSLRARLSRWLGRPPPATGPEANLSRAMSALDTHLSVTQASDTRVIKVVARSRSPAIAAAIANTVASTYLAEKTQAKIDAAAQMQKMLSDPLQELRSAARTSEEALEHYRRESGLVEVQDVPLVAREISGLTEQLVLARAALAEATSRATETGSAEGSRTEVAVQTAREATLEAELKRLTAEYNRQLEAQIHARELERDAATNEDLLRAFLERYKQMQLETLAERPGASVMAWAEEPVLPAAPQRVLLLGVACVAAAACAVALVLLWPVPRSGRV